MARDGGGGAGGGRTPFESMSHEQMLTWLDQASSAQVQDAADRLSAAAGEIRNIAQQLRFRPERVKWEGEGNQAFIEWGASLASSTFRLADYSDDASKWLSRASGAVATAQSSIPRYTTKESAQANLDAARAHHNDPDATTVAVKAEAALAATQEKNRQDAIAEMRKLAQAYDQSASEMDKLEVPTFRPPPGEFVPPAEKWRDSQDLYRSGVDGAAAGNGAGGAFASHASAAESAPGHRNAAAAARPTVPETPHAVMRPEMPPVATSIDSVSTLPLPATAPPVTPAPGPGRPDGAMTTLPVGLVPPIPGGPAASPAAGQSGFGRGPGTALGPVLPGQSSGGTGPGAGGVRPPRDAGVIGGRPVPHPSARPTGGIPRGTVIGGEGGGQVRPPMGHSAGGMNGGPRPGQGGAPVGRRLASEAGGVVGGRPVQPGVTGGRPFSQGGSGLVSGSVPGTPARPSSRRESTRGERRGYLAEDEETWSQNNRRVAPPVID
ncbi:WXG100 family type VII secretion target [Streptomyces sp. TRM49041]|uniref:WXG100 family type VII secretion target n=1 Tax=Streptomyces sp. TRM49041 TaxID=2603216 RepID=UPI0011EECB42|nr:WXG100 family type VII secretion target [Streptomyces sp. TRM49041]